MSDETKIEWCDSTFNPWYGCTKVSPACDHCYAEQWARRSGLVGWGPTQERRRSTDRNWLNPRKWERDAPVFFGMYKRKRRVFCASLADVFDNSAPALWREDLWQLIRETPSLDWQLLTKRPQNIAAMLPDDWNDGYPNVWLGTTVENQDEANRRIPHLLRVPCMVRFLSVEPMLGPVDLRRWSPRDTDDEFDGLHWVICGGESGHGARPLHPVWVKSLRDQCANNSIPFFFKQHGEWYPSSNLPTYGDETMDGGYTMRRIGKHAAGRLLDGRLHDDFPLTRTVK